MSAVFRRANQAPSEASNSSSFAEQIAEVDRWVSESANAKPVRGSTLDVGLNSRLNGDSVAVQGETLPLAFMQKLVDSQITRWLSLYPPFSEDT